MDIKTATPAEIDTELARLQAETSSLYGAIEGFARKIEQIQEMPHWQRVDYAGVNENELHELIDQSRDRLAEIVIAKRPLLDEFTARGGWTRYYLVEDGHLHYDLSSSRCSRTLSTTHYWMTEFSGQEPAEVIALAGERVCTTCFPEAPVAPRPAHTRFMTRTEAEKAAYAEAKARKAAAKKAAQITTPEGEELRVPRSFGGTDLIKTERAAWNRAMADATTIAWYGAKDAEAEREAIELCLAALAHRRDVTVESLRAELNTKIAAKARRESFEVLATV